MTPSPSPSPSPSPVGPPTLFVITHRPGPGWRRGVPAVDQDGVTEHFAYWQQLAAEGLILLGGPLMAVDAGGLIVLHANVGEARAQAVADCDPAVRAELILAEVIPWMITVGVPDGQG